MWDFSQLNLKIVSDFVGIKADDHGGYAFYLPKGFDDFIDKYQDANHVGDSVKFNKVRDFFFLMYRTLRKFDRDNENNSRITRKNTKNKKDQDKASLSTRGISLEYQEESECILYSKLSMIERVLEAYDDLAINSIEKKVRRSEEIDYSKIYKYLDRAIYLKNGAIYIDVMDLPRPMISYESTDIVNLYCFILDEIIQQLQEDVPDDVFGRNQDIQFLSQKFKDNYLTNDHSLFAPDTFEETIIVCKEALDNIDRNTHYKDTDYWGLYEAIETFLYGGLNPELDDGDFWGIQGEQGFDYVWEEMCQTYFFKQKFDSENNDFSEICFADTDIQVNGYKNDIRLGTEKNRVGSFNLESQDNELKPLGNKWFYQKQNCKISHPTTGIGIYWRELLCVEWYRKTRIFPNFQYPKHELFRQIYDKKLLRRYPQPDLILLKSKENDQHLVVIDFKNVSFKKYESYKHKSLDETDTGYRIALEKQLCYELALQQIFPEATIGNYFFIPFYFIDKPTSEQNCLGNVESRFSIRGIKIFKADFNLIQKVYLGIVETSDIILPNDQTPTDISRHHSRKQKQITFLENQPLKSDYVPLLSFQNEKQRKIATDYIIEQVKIFFQEIGVNIPNLVEFYFPYSESIIAEEFKKVDIEYFYDNLFYDLGEKKEDRDENGKLKVKPKWCITFHINSTPIKVPQLKIPNSDSVRHFGTIDIVGTPILYYIYFTLPELLEIILPDSKNVS
jgi:hypothetical protein